MQSKIIPIVLIAVLGTIGSFMILSIVFVDYSTQHVCPLSMISDVCYTAINSFALVNHHLSSVQYLAQAIISFNPTLLLFSSFFLVISLLVFGGLFQKVFSKQNFVFQTYCILKFMRAKVEDKFFLWLALRNKQGPRLPPFRVYA